MEGQFGQFFGQFCFSHVLLNVFLCCMSKNSGDHDSVSVSQGQAIYTGDTSVSFQHV
jgi:hypothetical protein